LAVFVLSTVLSHLVQLATCSPVASVLADRPREGCCSQYLPASARSMQSQVDHVTAVVHTTCHLMFTCLFVRRCTCVVGRGDTAIWPSFYS